MKFVNKYTALTLFTFILSPLTFAYNYTPAIQEEVQSENALDIYDILKPYHIQQDKRDGCSAATSLMVINAIKKMKDPEWVPWTQAEFRQWLGGRDDDLQYWLGKISGKGIGVSFSRLLSYLKLVFPELEMDDVQIRGQRVGSTSYSQFKADLLQSSQSDNEFILVNFSGHWSPVGKFDPINNIVTILDVDYVENYSREFHYELGKGEDHYSAYSLFYKRMDGYIVIQVPKE